MIERRRLGITIFLVLSALLGPARVALADDGADSVFHLSLETSNNHFDLDTLLRGAALAELGSIRPSFDTLMGWGNMLLRASLTEDDGRGLYAQLLAWYRSSGETALFVYNAAADRVPATGELYDLEADYEQYFFLGIYASRATGNPGRGAGRLYLNAFICPNYEAIALMGYGYLHPDGGEQEFEAQAAGRHDVLPWGDSFGLGGSLSWQGHFTWSSGLSLDIEAHNLLGLVYFPDLTRYNEHVDYQSVSPTPIEGHLERGQALVSPPCLLKGTLSYPCLGGGGAGGRCQSGKCPGS